MGLANASGYCAFTNVSALAYSPPKETGLRVIGNEFTKSGLRNRLAAASFAVCHRTVLSFAGYEVGAFKRLGLT